MWRKRLQARLLNAARWLQPKPDLSHVNQRLADSLSEAQAQLARQRSQRVEFLSEMVEAQAMAGPGPWHAADTEACVMRASEALGVSLKEAGPVSTLGAQGMFELLLNNMEWVREINYSWLEFSRYGIQQIILISRLYYLKNPIVRRLVDVCAAYVFARGVDVTTQDQDANDILREFFVRNQRVLGHVALTELEKTKDRDGNIFFAFFADAEQTGQVDVRIIDATEIQDIRCNPEDADEPWYYLRVWTSKQYDAQGKPTTKTLRKWYPALNYNPQGAERLAAIGADEVLWDKPVYHRKVGIVGKWQFGCPRIFPMLDWAKEARRYLEACGSIAQSLAQFAFSITTKGGQQAVEGIKQEMQTQVGPPNPLWDTNPPAIAGSTWISGPGTKIEAMKTTGAGLDPEKVRQPKLMCCMVKGVPETFLGDVSTGNLATATSLDRPTETVFLNLQEEWVEDFTIMGTFVLETSLRAPRGRLREALEKRGAIPAAISVRECAREMSPTGRMRYVEAKTISKDIEVRVDFPAIREGDMAAIVKATVEAMTLDNKGGQIVGIDEKEGTRMLFRSLGNERGDEIIEEMYPTTGPNKYDPLRAKDVLPPPVGKLPDKSGVPPTPGDIQQDVDAEDLKPKEALRGAADRLVAALDNLGD